MPYQETPYQKVNIVDANGNIISSSSSGGDASAVNQQTEIAKLISIDSKTTSDPATGSKQDEQITGLNALLTSLGQTTDNAATNDNDVNLISLAKGIFSKIYYFLNDENAYYQLENIPGNFVDISTKNYSRLILRFPSISPTEGTQIRITLLDQDNQNTSLPALGYIVGQSEKQSNSFNGKIVKTAEEYIIKTDFYDYGLYFKSPTLRISWFASPAAFPVTIIVRPCIESKEAKVLESINNNFGEDITGTTIPAGGTGIRGLLSWIAKLVSDTYGTLRDRIPQLTLNGDKLKVDLTNTASTPIFVAPFNSSPTSVQGTVTANLGTIGAIATETTLNSLSARFPAMVAAIDNVPFNNSTTFITAPMLFNGASWDRPRSPSSTGEGLGRSMIASGTKILTLLSAATVPVTGGSQNLYSTYSKITAQLIINSGIITGFSCVIEGSFNNIKWFTLGTLSDPTDGAQISSMNICFISIRARIVSIAGTNPNVTILAGACP